MMKTAMIGLGMASLGGALFSIPRTVFPQPKPGNMLLPARLALIGVAVYLLGAEELVT
mgnify:FL=1